MAKGKGRGGPRGDYYKKVLQEQSSDLIALWRLNELGGTVCGDMSKEGNNGAYGATSLGNALGPDRHICPLFDGSTSYLDIYSAAFNTDWSEAAGSVAGWAKVASAAVWADSTKRRILTLAADANNYVAIDKSATANRLDFFHVAGSTSDSVTDSTTIGASVDWFHVALTWSVADDAIFAYINGAQAGTATGLGTWSGALASTTAVIGSSSTTAADVWSGWLSNIAVWKVALSASEIARLANLY